jgi:3-hydroxyacyl-[acyl-carrier-protein] dehydratase
MQASTPEDDPALCEALKRCSPATYYAACKFRKAGRREDLRAVVYGVFERFVERELRPKVSEAGDTLRLREDFGIDSLTMMEVVMIAEDVLGITVTNDELTKLHTLGDVQAFILAKVQSPPTHLPGTKLPSEQCTWNFAAVTEDVRRTEADAARPGPQILG